MANEKLCTKCKTPLKFEAEIGAPGKGYSYSCPGCGTGHWGYRGSVTPWDDVNPESIELSINDVI